MIEVLYQLYITLIMIKRLSVCSLCLAFNYVYMKEILVNCGIPILLLSASLYKKLKAFWRVSESRTICLLHFPGRTFLCFKKLSSDDVYPLLCLGLYLGSFFHYDFWFPKAYKFRLQITQEQQLFIKEEPFIRCFPCVLVRSGNWLLCLNVASLSPE